MLNHFVRFTTQLPEAEVRRITAKVTSDVEWDTFGTSGPSGLGTVEDVFLDYFASQGLQTEHTEFDGRSDYEAFINAGIPAGGPSAARKTSRRPSRRRSTAAPPVPHDAYYHQACDDLSNLNKTSILVSEILGRRSATATTPGQATLTELAEYGAGTVGNSQRLLAEILRSKRIRRDRPTAGCAVGARC